MRDGFSNGQGLRRAAEGVYAYEGVPDTEIIPTKSRPRPWWRRFFR